MFPCSTCRNKSCWIAPKKCNLQTACTVVNVGFGQKNEHSECTGLCVAEGAVFDSLLQQQPVSRRPSGVAGRGARTCSTFSGRKHSRGRCRSRSMTGLSGSAREGKTTCSGFMLKTCKDQSPSESREWVPAAADRHDSQGQTAPELQSISEDPCGRHLVCRRVSLGVRPQDRDRGSRKLSTAGFPQPGFLKLVNYWPNEDKPPPSCASPRAPILDRARSGES